MRCVILINILILNMITVTMIISIVTMIAKIYLLHLAAVFKLRKRVKQNKLVKLVFWKNLHQNGHVHNNDHAEHIKLISIFLMITVATVAIQINIVTIIAKICLPHCCRSISTSKSSE